MMTNSPEASPVCGALVGWKRAPTSNGYLMTLQLAETASDYYAHNFQRIEFAMNDRQLRSLTRDLMRAAEERGIELWSRSTRIGGLFPRITFGRRLFELAQRIGIFRR